MKETKEAVQRKEHEPSIVAESYGTWLRLSFSHVYFGKEACGLEIEPDHSTALLLRKSGVLFKKYNATTWLLIKTGNLTLDPEHSLVFRLKPLIPEFYYCTGTFFLDAKGVAVEDVKVGSWKMLKIDLSDERLQQKETETIQVSMNSISKYLEFLVFPSVKGLSGKLEIREENNNLKLKKGDEQPLPGTENYLWRFVSKEQVTLTQKSQYRFHLWEVRKTGDNMLARLTDFPRVKDASPFSPKDTITSYYYL